MDLENQLGSFDLMCLMWHESIFLIMSDSEYHVARSIIWENPFLQNSSTAFAKQIHGTGSLQWLPLSPTFYA